MIATQSKRMYVFCILPPSHYMQANSPRCMRSESYNCITQPSVLLTEHR